MKPRTQPPPATATPARYPAEVPLRALAGILGIGILSTLLWGCQGVGATDGTGGERSLEVRRGALIERILLTGELAAENALELAAPDVEVWPLQIRWMAEDGAEVAGGDVVVEFDNSALASRFEESKTAVIQAENDLSRALSQAAADEEQAHFTSLQNQAALAKARLDAAVPEELTAAREYERLQLELERAQLELEEARQGLESTRRSGRYEVEIKALALKKSRGELQRVQEGVDRLAVKAPQSGIVLIESNFSERRIFQSGDSVFPGQTMVSLPDLDTLIVEARLYDVDDGRITPGAAAAVTLDAYPLQTFTGRIEAVEQVAKETEGRSARRAFGVKITLDAIDQDLMRPGMSAKVVVEHKAPEQVTPEQATTKQTLLAPRRGLRFLGTRRARAFAGGGWKDVELGPCNEVDCVVLEGLEEGDLLKPVYGLPGSGA